MTKVKTEKIFGNSRVSPFHSLHSLVSSAVILTDELRWLRDKGRAVGGVLSYPQVFHVVLSASHCVDDTVKVLKGQTSQG